MRRVEHVEALDAERTPQHLGREARAAHAEQHDGVEPRRRRRRRTRSSSTTLAHPPRLVEPAEPRASSAPVQSGRVALPDPLDQLARLGHAAASSPRFARTPSSSSSNESANFWTPSSLERLDDVVVVDAGLRELHEQLVRLVDVLDDGVAANLAVVLKRLDRLERHRVHGVRPDQLLDVDHVAVVRVLRRRRRPEAALLRCALPARNSQRGRRRTSPGSAVGELRVRDRELALQLRVPTLEPLVGLGVDARDEERRDGRTFDGSPPVATRRSSPRRYASTTSL